MPSVRLPVKGRVMSLVAAATLPAGHLASTAPTTLFLPWCRRLVPTPTSGSLPVALSVRGRLHIPNVMYA